MSNKKNEPLSFPISYPLGRAWYVLAVNPPREFNAERKIRGQYGFTVYTPRVLNKKIIRLRKVTVATPLFPGYVFVNFDIYKDNWTKIIEEIDGIAILTNCDIPVRVATQTIEALQRAELAGAFDYRKPGSAFKVGDDVEIKVGPFAGMIAKVRSATQKRRARVALNFLGRLSIFNFETCDLVKI